MDLPTEDKNNDNFPLRQCPNEHLQLSRTSSESTFTRRTNKIHSIIKEILMGIICILQMWMLLKTNS